MALLTRFPLSIVIPLFLSMVALVIEWHAFRNAQMQSDDDVVRDGQEFVNQLMIELQSSINNHLLKGDLEGARTTISRHAANPKITLLVLVDDGGKVMNSTNPALVGLNIGQGVPDVNPSLMALAGKTLANKLSVGMGSNLVAAYYPVIIDSARRDFRPHRVGIIHLRYNLSGDLTEHRAILLSQARLTAVFYALCFLLLAIFLHQILTKRVKVLVAAARQIAAGDLSAHTGLQGQDEISQVGEAFDRMAVEIARNNQDLEQRVSERTRDLQKKGEELQDIQKALTNIVEDLAVKTRELEQSNVKLKELDQLKSLFIASMSHELRTPLNSIIGFSSILHDEWIGPVNVEQKENLSIILSSGKHLLNLINDIIDVSRIEAGKIEPNIEEFDLSDLIAEAAAMLEKEAQDKALELRVVAERVRMCTDRCRLLQCTLNLLSNAIKYTEKGGVTIEAQLIDSPGAGTGEAAAEISVSDTGIGIREEEIQKLYQPFSRLESSLHATAPGTGLGLYLTRRVVAEVLMGDILMTSSYGRGSRFTIRIPARLP